MSTTVIDALHNAKINFETLGNMGLSKNPFFVIAMEQLKNGIEALDNGLNADDVIQGHIFGEVDTGEK